MTKMANNLMNKFFARFSYEYQNRTRICSIKSRDALGIDEHFIVYSFEFISLATKEKESSVRKFVKFLNSSILYL